MVLTVNERSESPFKIAKQKNLSKVEELTEQT
jgi:hypothetical protein